jgi:hypothetical protein
VEGQVLWGLPGEVVVQLEVRRSMVDEFGNPHGDIQWDFHALELGQSSGGSASRYEGAGVVSHHGATEEREWATGK